MIIFQRKKILLFSIHTSVTIELNHNRIFNKSHKLCFEHEIFLSFILLFLTSPVYQKRKGVALCMCHTPDHIVFLCLIFLHDYYSCC